MLKILILILFNGILIKIIIVVKIKLLNFNNFRDKIINDKNDLFIVSLLFK